MIRETTPARITQVIIDFCASITSDSSPEYIDVCPAPWASLNECFNNVSRMVKQYGGSMILGWTVWQRGNMLLDAEAHAIWRAPDGKPHIVITKSEFSSCLILPFAIRELPFQVTDKLLLILLWFQNSSVSAP